MRFLILDANYPGFLRDLYEREPSLAGASFDAQYKRIQHELFGEAGFQINALRGLGHEADLIITNAGAAQRAWANEHGVSELAAPRWRIRRRGGVLPWPERTAPTWDLVVRQVKEYGPDVLYVGILDSLPAWVLSEMRPHARLVVAQIAAALPSWSLVDYDLVFSSIPALVDRIRSLGIDAEWLPLAFDPSALVQVPPRPRDIPVSFIGSFSEVHQGRIALLEAISEVSPLMTWTTDRAYLSRTPSLARTVHGAVFGREMYAVLARSLITLNAHATWAGNDANNLRLYEATGMGALLVTDDKANLGELFEVGSELVTYRTPKEAAEVVRYYLDHAEEARAIASAGQARTLREHTWADRMLRVVEAANTRL